MQLRATQERASPGAQLRDAAAEHQLAAQGLHVGGDGQRQVDQRLSGGGCRRGGLRLAACVACCSCILGIWTECCPDLHRGTCTNSGAVRMSVWDGILTSAGRAGLLSSVHAAGEPELAESESAVPGPFSNRVPLALAGTSGLGPTRQCGGPASSRDGAAHLWPLAELGTRAAARSPQPSRAHASSRAWGQRSSCSRSPPGNSQPREHCGAEHWRVQLP